MRGWKSPTRKRVVLEQRQKDINHEYAFYAFNPTWAPVIVLLPCDEITPLSTEDIN